MPASAASAFDKGGRKSYIHPMSEFALESPPAVQPQAEPYRVLARKYRPSSFADLIGQDAMVRTLGNAIRRDRLAHAFLLTGVRGVGKTSTARLIAKALNCIGPDGEGAPTIDPCGICEPCRAIAEGRYIDVVEMDAASHTGVDDVREIIEAARYAAVDARFKIYIIDEVHMLSKNAFNALLKTLEEPPAHVKFIFATTELAKVPVTVLSRCQRFDLRRIPAETLTHHFAMVAKAEGAEVESEALSLIAAAAEGSVRDGLSILDQAIAHGSGAVTAEMVAGMLGLSDRGAVRVLLEAVFSGDRVAVLEKLGDQYELGVAPDMVVEGLLSLVHAVTRVQVGAAPDAAMAAEERQAVEKWAQAVKPAMLHRFWQLLLKGLGEVRGSPMPLEAAEMLLLRLVHAGTLPDPGALIEALGARAEATPEAPPAAPVPSPEREPALALANENDAPQAPADGTAPGGDDNDYPADFSAFLKLVARLEPRLEAWLYDEVGLLAYAPPVLELAGQPAPANVVELVQLLRDATGADWTIRVMKEASAPSVHELSEKRAADERTAVLADPNVKHVFEVFPQASLVGYELAAEGGETETRKRRAQ